MSKSAECYLESYISKYARKCHELRLLFTSWGLIFWVMLLNLHEYWLHWGRPRVIRCDAIVLPLPCLCTAAYREQNSFVIPTWWTCRERKKGFELVSWLWTGFLTLNQLLTSNTQIRINKVFFLCLWRWSHSQKSTWHCTKFWWQFLSWTISVTWISHTQGENTDCLHVLLQWNPLLNSW